MDPYQRLRHREIYRNPWLGVEVHEIVHPTGVPGEHVLIASPQAVGVLVEHDGALIFANQPRFGARTHVVEIVKGGADEGEDVLVCAKRELREELGIEAADWQALGFTYEIPSIMNAPVYLFLARAIAQGAQDLEEVERIEAVSLSIEDAFAAADDGRINDAVTIAALYRYRSRYA